MEECNGMEEGGTQEGLTSEQSLPIRDGTKYEEKHVSTEHKTRLVTVEPALTLYFMVLIPSGPLIRQFIYSEVAALKNYTVPNYGDDAADTCRNQSTNDSNYLLQQEVQSLTATWNIYMEIANTFPSLVALLVFGPLSDLVGRKIAIMCPVVGTTLKFVLYISTMAWHLPFYVLLFAEAIEGFLGGPGTIVTASFAYLADVYSGTHRTIRFSILDVAFGVFGSLANIGMGYFIQSQGFFYPFFLLVGLNLTNLVYVVFGIPETRTSQKGVSLCSVKPYTRSFYVVHKPSLSSNKWKIALIIVGFCLSFLVVSSRRGLQTLYVLNSPLCWGSVLIGYYNAYSSVLSNAGNIIITLLLVRRIGEIGLVMVGSVSGALSMLLLSAVFTTWMMFLVPVLGIASFVVRPMLRAAISGLVPSNELGSLFAGISAIEGLISLAGSSAMNAIYGATLLFFKGFVFLILAVGYVILFALMMFYTIKNRKEGNRKDNVQGPSTSELEGGPHHDEIIDSSLKTVRNSSTGSILNGQIIHGGRTSSVHSRYNNVEREGSLSSKLSYSSTSIDVATGLSENVTVNISPKA